jgi:ADP-ribose pyrophosphatase
MSGKETVFRTPWFDIATVDPGAEPSGTTEPYFCLVRKAGVLAFVLDVSGNIVLVEQYRPPIGRSTLEMPAGTIDEGETPGLAVVREVLEETGYVCEKWHQISPFRVMLNREDVVDFFFVGLGARKVDNYPGIEGGVTRVTPRSQFLDLLRTRRFEQVAALGGMYLAERIADVDLLTADLGEIQSKLSAMAGEDK